MTLTVNQTFPSNTTRWRWRGIHEVLSAVVDESGIAVDSGMGKDQGKALPGRHQAVVGPHLEVELRDHVLSMT